MEQEIVKIKVKKLKLWSENPRDPLDGETSDFDIICNAITEKSSKWKLDKLIKDLRNGYDFSELPTVVKINNKYIVYDGNRRIAILKYLQNEKDYLKKDIILNHKSSRNLIEQITLPCNVCSIETALENIERKHFNNGSWDQLEREYFYSYHRNQKKSLFLKLEEETGLISSNDNLNKRFVKDEVLTDENLKKIGIGLNENDELISNYDDEFTRSLFNSIIHEIENDNISTRKNRGKLLNVLIKGNPSFEDKIKPFSSSTSSIPLKKVYDRSKNTSNENNRSLYSKEDSKVAKRNSENVNRTPVKNDDNLLFGGKLILKSGNINDLYRAIESIYNCYDKDKNNEVLSIVGMSLRLILEVTARDYYLENNDKKADEDQILGDFLKLAKKEMIIKQEDFNFLSITKDWLHGGTALDALLAKYAHGNIKVDKSNVLKISIIVGQILTHFQGKK